jgi:molybdopterin converting factor small subunit
MTERPDSALNILLDVNPDDLHTRKQRAKHALLLSMALDKNYIDIADDSIISIAYNYFQHHPTKREKMLATYYSGIVNQNAGNTIKAAIDFNQALYLAKELNDNHNAGLSCRHLSTIYSQYYNHLKALTYSEQAVGYFEACGESLSADYARTNVAFQLLSTFQWEESIRIVDDVINRISHKSLIREALGIKTEALLWGRNDYSGAMACLELKSIGRQSTDTLTYYSYKALISEALDKQKDADMLFHLAESYMKTAIDSLTLFDLRARAKRMRRDYKGAYEDLFTATEIQNKEITEVLGDSISSAMEDWYRESYTNQKERNRLMRIVYSVLGILLLFTIIALFLWARKLRLDRIQDMADIESLNNDLQVLKERNEHFRKASNAVIMDKVQFLHQLSDSYFSWTDDAVKKREKEKGVQTKDEIISRFRQQLGEMRSDRSFVKSLEDAVNASTDNLIQNLRTEYKDNLKELDFNILTMMYSGLSIKSIAFYFRMTEPSIRTRKTRYKHLFEESGSPLSGKYIGLMD